MKIQTTDDRPGAGQRGAVLESQFFGRACRLLPVLLLLAHPGYAAPAEPEAVPASQPADQPAMPEGTAPDQQQTWRFVTILAASGTYDDNIFIQPTNKTKDYYVNIDPTFAAGVGNFRDALASFANIPDFLVQPNEEDLPWRNFMFISYTPDGIIFKEFHKEDHLNHDARLAAQQERDLWTIKSDLHFHTESEPVIDVGRRINQTDYTADLNAAYALTGKLTAGSELYGQHSDYTGGFASTDGRVSGYLDYQIAPKTALGFAGTGGYLHVAHGSSQPYEQALVQVKYLPTEKVSFNAKAGGEYRQYESNIPNRTQLVFDVSGNYAPTDSTQFTLRANRDTLASAEYSGEDIVESVYQASVRQRFVQRLYLILAGGLEHNNYESNEPTVTVSRHDDYYFYQPSLSCDVTQHGTVQLSYEHRENKSSLAAFKFTENLYSVAASFLF